MRQIQLLDLKSLKPSSVINNCLWTQSQKSSRTCMEIKLQYPQTSIIGTADFTCKSCSLLNKQLIHYVVRKSSNSKVYLHGLDIGREVYWNNIMTWTFIKANLSVTPNNLYTAINCASSVSLNCFVFKGTFL